MDTLGGLDDKSMLIKANSIIGKPIFTLVKGKKLKDKVEDLIFDPKTNKIEALLLDQGGLFSDAKVILMQDLHSVGDDVVIIKSEEIIKRGSEINQDVTTIAKGGNYLIANKVITEDGKDLGEIVDLLFDSGTGKVKEFEVSQGVLKNIESGKKTVMVFDIITIGENAIIVGSKMGQIFDEQSKKRGVAGAFNQVKAQAPFLFEEINRKTKDVREHPKTQEWMQKIKGTAKEVGQKAQKKAEEIRRSPKTRSAIRAFKKEFGKIKEGQRAYLMAGTKGGKAKRTFKRKNLTAKKTVRK